LIVKDKKIISTGYVGSIAGQPHCSEVGHLMVKRLNNDDSISEHCVRTVHAEQNAIAQAVKNGVSTEGATIYITMEPCDACARLLIQCGIVKVVCQKRYHSGQLTRELLRDAGVELFVVSDENLKY
jgi:dCMP deaminase